MKRIYKPTGRAAEYSPWVQDEVTKERQRNARSQAYSRKNDKHNNKIKERQWITMNL